MAEHSIFPEVITQNGHSPEPTPDPVPEALPLPRLDVARKVFITSASTEIPLTGKPISSLMLERVVAEGKPRIPQIEVTVLGKHKQMQANPNDPGYLALLKEWETEQKIATLRYMFVIGVKGSPPDDFVGEQREFFPNATNSELKYLWVSSLLPDDDIDSFTAAILGRSLATEAGLQESADNFPGENQRDSSG